LKGKVPGIVGAILTFDARQHSQQQNKTMNENA